MDCSQAGGALMYFAIGNGRGLRKFPMSGSGLELRLRSSLPLKHGHFSSKHIPVYTP